MKAITKTNILYAPCLESKFILSYMALFRARSKPRNTNVEKKTKVEENSYLSSWSSMKSVRAFPSSLPKSSEEIFCLSAHSTEGAHGSQGIYVENQWDSEGINSGANRRQNVGGSTH